MATTQALCSQFKVDVLQGAHAFFTPLVTRATLVTDTFKAALYLTAASLGANTTIYSATNEVGANGTYSAGGVAFTWSAPVNSTPGGTANGSSTAYVNPSAANIQVTTFSATGFDSVLIYNDTAATKRAISVHTFGAQSITSGTFTLTFPNNTSTEALIRIV